MKIIIALPAYNEELVVEKSVLETLEFCRQNFKDEFEIVIADNNSTDMTGEIGKRLAAQEKEIKYFFIPEKGKGVAWRTVFLALEADIYIVMDIDLAVSLPATLLLAEAIHQGNDLAIGSRFLKDSKVERSFFREIISSGYRFLAQIIFWTKISDFQCGFKGLSRKLRNEVLPLTEEKRFFLDSEIIILSKVLGYRIKEVPVEWSEFRDKKRKSTVNILSTILEYLKRVWYLKKKAKRLSKEKNS